MTDDTLAHRHAADELDTHVDVDMDPIADPGLPEHLPRPTDVDPKLEKRAERQVAALFGLSTISALLFCVAYFYYDIGDDPDIIGGFGASTVALGLTLGIAFVSLGVGLVHWTRKLMVDHEIVEMRHPVSSPPEDRDYAVAAFKVGVEESGIMRRPLIRNSLLGAVGAAFLPIIIGLRDLGPLPGNKLYHTVWKKGMRVVRDVSGEPISVADMQIGDLINAEPEVFFDAEKYNEHEFEGEDLQIAKAKAPVIVVRMPVDDITPDKGRENWGYEGILVYSKICTHVGCPISLLEQQNHHLLCPCHQSTFDLSDNGKVVFGPAGRSLPQLPITVDSEGFIMAQSDFTEPVGPSFWERDNTR